jgi:hypothetical protein
MGAMMFGAGGGGGRRRVFRERKKTDYTLKRNSLWNRKNKAV